MSDQIFHITGRIIDRQTRLGLARLRVEAWDKDQQLDDRLGWAVTDGEGVFRITFAESPTFMDALQDRLPDVYFKIFCANEDLERCGLFRIGKHIAGGLL